MFFQLSYSVNYFMTPTVYLATPFLPFLQVWEGLSIPCIKDLFHFHNKHPCFFIGLYEKLKLSCVYCDDYLRASERKMNFWLKLQLLKSSSPTDKQTLTWPQIGTSPCVHSAHSNHQSAAWFTSRWHLSGWKTWIRDRGREREKVGHTIPASRVPLLGRLCVCVCLCMCVCVSVCVM